MDFEAVARVRADFDTLVRDVRPQLLRYCARMTGSALDGEDIVQEARLAIWFDVGVVDGRPATLACDRAGTAPNYCLDVRFRGERFSTSGTIATHLRCSRRHTGVSRGRRDGAVRRSASARFQATFRARAGP